MNDQKCKTCGESLFHCGSSIDGECHRCYHEPTVLVHHERTEVHTAEFSARVRHDGGTATVEVYCPHGSPYNGPSFVLTRTEWQYFVHTVEEALSMRKGR